MVAYLSLSGSGREVGWGGRLFEAGRLLTFPAFRMGAYSRWALIRDLALIRINTVVTKSLKIKRLNFFLRKKKKQRIQKNSKRIFIHANATAY